ncbi:gliding motility-associated C-terminal domain-containing protein [Chryseobacterium carnipullorum]|uniref:Gliding motility-associated C-terminal domain-containing protein n=1 Tax=Chryseobacterium carnipullorum TaxID=1124835 RepID=A0A3G6LYB1_CHRCU|nr:T9SS type B sorting domain-containing protein [Chryseobacterium carnipullorum]AZA46948.1 gliding motility-associated C-terminal domain-containing protein [Chryseobacterium carnipullorum]AZA66302.1 gliding motility-associated C-terminal domain-containing protein [Chryseobacterium carnipullorum]
MKKLLLLIFFGISQIFFAQADCATALAVCGNSNITYSPTGYGDIRELVNSGSCIDATGEHNSIWYKITIATGGTLTFDLVPNNPDADYDWAIFGPNVTCGSLGSPVRCNAATVIGVGPSTGLNMTSTITNALGGSLTPYCKYMDVLPGQTYYLFIDNWVSSTSSTTAPFSLTWGGTATLASPFTDPATQPHPFNPPGVPAANPADPREVIICVNPAVFDFSTLSAGILNGNPNFNVSYHTSQNDALTGSNAITVPTTVNTTSIYYYSIGYTDPANPNSPLNQCKQIGTFKFKDGKITAKNATLTQCNNNNAGTAIYDLTTADVIGDPTATKKYYNTLSDLNAGINEITNPSAFTSAEATIYVKVTSSFGCTSVAQIMLKFHPVVIVNDATVRSCSIESSPSTASFNLAGAIVTSQNGTVKKYYPSATDAANQTNEILTTAAYIAPSGVVYVRVSNAQGCFNIAKITLVVIPPVYSNILKDKTICVEDKTTLDAGPGFNSYEWSTGATTQTITNVGVGTYWVKLKTGDCTVVQNVKVYPSEQPVVSSIEISSTTVTVFVIGGTPAYKYSMDNVNWQDSNVFNNVKRGDATVFVKDSYDCDPIDISIVVPNLVNVITPNGDGYNDVIDYSALASKKNLVMNIYDRYGNMIFQVDKSTGYKWDGTSKNGVKVPTGNYWYSVGWNENDKMSTPIKYSGWIVVKNRD